MVFNRKMSSEFSASFHCFLQMFRCKFIILLYDSCAHNRDYFTFAQLSSRSTEQIYKRTHFTQAVKLSNIFVILKEIIVAFTTSNLT